ncbi:homoserine dehydrogenase [Clostridium sp. DJ247]|uniref:homoserine dehydrogenase n=1 Tax=Clostridium sp. DJ247 TaxID=2726188 RepID=UPI0016248286|nr:homoserine dehydrogenase [Clostridium sp. DJ247]MBC2579541.1 homoserine dehydrogenase [Clostridium sp. DJ247]
MISIAILGYGVVGTGITQLINKNKDRTKKTTGEDIIISNILVRDINKHKKKGNSHILTDNIDEVFEKPLDIVVELMGGVNPAYNYVKRALLEKKHVVTANKDLIAEHGKELLDLATENDVTLNFEASVGGGIPILKPLIECLSVNEIIGIKAILNGTTNFILSKMDKENMSYEDALKLAQELGFAEANPSSDVLGYDAARKISILSTISYDKRVNCQEIGINGITNIDKEDFKYAKLAGCTIKLLAISEKQDNRIHASVQPVMVKLASPLAQLDNELNGIIIEGDAVGDIFFSGKGAGMLPTASAVFGDIIDIIQNKSKKITKFSNEPAEIDPKWNKEASWLIRVKTNNRLDTISNLANSFKNCYIYSEILTNHKEVVALISNECEHHIDSILSEISTLSSSESVKKFMVLSHN